VILTLTVSWETPPPQHRLTTMGRPHRHAAAAHASTMARSMDRWRSAAMQRNMASARSEGRAHAPHLTSRRRDCLTAMVLSRGVLRVHGAPRRACAAALARSSAFENV
jgi:hypothetical protein